MLAAQASREQACELYLARDIDDEHAVDPCILLGVLRQQRHDDHRVGAAWRGRPPAQRIAYARMQDAFESVPRGRVGEHALAQGAAVERACDIEDARAECGDDLLQGGSAGLDEFARDDVRVDHIRAERRE